jgi:prepilin-type processing-associated H-X9-DG protein
VRAHSFGASWAVLILPNLEEDNLYKRWHLDAAYNEQSPAARQTPVKVYFCPSRRNAKSSGVSVDGDITDNHEWGHGNSTARYGFFSGALGDYAASLGTGACLGNQMDDDTLFSDHLRGRGAASGQGQAWQVLRYVGYGHGATNASNAQFGEYDLPENNPSLWVSRILSCSSGAFERRNGVRLADIRDGTSTTLLVGEKHVPRGSEGRGAIGQVRVTIPSVSERESHDVAPAGGGDNSIYNGQHFQGSTRAAGIYFPIAKHPSEGGWKFGSLHDGGVTNFAFCDGHVQALRPSVFPRTLQALAGRNDEMIPGTDY